MEVLHVYVEPVTANAAAEERYPGIAAHLNACGPCSEDFTGLLAAITRTALDSPLGQWEEMYRGKTEPLFDAHFGAAVVSVAPTREQQMTVQLGVLGFLEAKEGKGSELGAFLESGRAIAAAEPGTVTWYAFETGDASYGIFGTFETEDAREEHVHGEIPRDLAQVAQDLLAADPDIRMVDVIAVKEAPCRDTNRQGPSNESSP